MTTIYVLELEQGKYYVGKTNNNRPVDERFEEHKQRGSSWTKMYKPIKTIQEIANADNHDEDKYTKIYMEKYGIDNVRGGSYTQLILSESQIEAIEREFRTSQDKCYRCGHADHFSRECKTRSGIPDDKCFKCNQPGHIAKDCQVIVEEKCFKCDQPGHIAKDCQAVTEEKCYKCNQPGHIAKNCQMITEEKCYKCKQTGHIAKNCMMVECRWGCNVSGHIPRETCYKCNNTGHLARDCKVSINDTCYKCHQRGHIAKDCRIIQDKCYKCQQLGHIARECKMPIPDVSRHHNRSPEISNDSDHVKRAKISHEPNPEQIIEPNPEEIILEVSTDSPNISSENSPEDTSSNCMIM